ncbi:IS66 Orf2 like protein [Shewanella psychrophila]|uniref:IS66 Orf2 like protein n=1 Tax=Shewanella psychrophila TaxID=225848 RepID=A0A1S6HM76_9GAMM|nr:IS66 family insertion sequence element accessory protein TnpB [Shewanella psychrophila]AQS36623.1 IS66 Orf2 like protein [Shewanella psychrophila]
MIHLTANTKIFIATEPADFRKGIDGLSAVCRLQLAKDPRSGTVFVFINRSKTMIRALTYDGTGFWLMTKRLSTGKFKRWPRSTIPVTAMVATQLRQLLSGGVPQTFIGK